MGGTIWLDEDYDSGVPGCPGARFVVDLQTPPTELREEGVFIGSPEEDIENHQNGASSKNKARLRELPKQLNVLFVDDDQILRKMFTRKLNQVAPEWNVRQAANGETALRLTDEQHFDLIFMDMYMASVEKSLLGTETVAALRAKGVTNSRICGLSANELKQQFLDAGADYFMLKPFPTDPNFLHRELLLALGVAGDKAFSQGPSPLDEVKRMQNGPTLVA
jgi:CheY-like chemotaxis protein